MVPLGELDLRMGLVGRSLIVGGVTTLFLMLLVGWLIANRVLRPVTRLTQTANRIASSSDFTRRVEIPRSQDELSQLAQTFNSMMGKLEGERQLLEARVLERTAELEASQNRAEFLAALGDAVQALGDPDEVVRVAFERLGVLLRAEYLSLSWVGEERISLGQVWGHLPGGLEVTAQAGLRRNLGGMLWRVVEGKQALYSNNYAHEDYHIDLGLENYAIAAEPIIDRQGKIVATLSVGRPSSPLGWQSSEQDLLKRAANTLGLALERSERLSQAETRVDLAIEATNLGLWSIDLGSDRVSWGGRHAELYGFPSNTREIPLGQQEALVWPEDLPLIQSRLSQAIQDFEPYEIEYRICRQDNNEWRWILARGQAIKGADGKAKQILGTIIDITARHKALEQIEASMQAERQTAAQLAAMFENLSVGIALFDSDLRYHRVNPMLAQINKIPIEEHLGKTLEEILPLTSQTIRPYIEQVFSSGKAVSNIELSETHPDSKGQATHFLASWFPVSLNGQTTMVGAVVQDVTERKRVEERSHYLAEVLEEVSEAVISTDLEFRVLSWNKGAETIYGWTEREAIGQSVEEFLRTEFTEGDQELALKTINQTDVWTGEVVQYHRNGQPINIISTVRIYRDQQQRPVGVVASNRNITQRKMAENALMERERFVQNLVQTAPAVIYVLELQGFTNTYVSPKGAELLGYDLEEWQLLWKEPRDLLHPDDWGRAEMHLKMLIQSKEGEILELENRMRHKDGSWHWFLSRDTVSDYDNDGKAIAVLGVATDITARKEAEQALHQSRARLELGVQVAGLALAEVDYINGLVTLSPEAATLYGLSAEGPTVSRERIHATFHPDDREELETIIALTLDPQGSGTFACDHRVVHPDGSVYWLNVRKQVFFDREADPPRPLRATLAALDITARKRQELNRAILAEVQAAVARLSDPSQVAAVAGENLVKHLALSQCLFAEIDGVSSIATVFHHSRLGSGQQMLGNYPMTDFHTLTEQQRLEGGQTVVIEDLSADGRSFEAVSGFRTLGVQAMITVPYLSGGRLRFAISVQQDNPRVWQTDEVEFVREVTALIYSLLERVRAEKALSDSEERYRTLFESIDQGFCVIEMIYQNGQAVDYRFIEVNPMFEAQTGLKNPQGRTALELVPNLEQEWFDLYANVAETGIQRRFEQASEAMGRWFEAYALRVGKPEQQRVALLFSDISQRKHDELALRQSEQRLEMAVLSGGIGIFDWDIPNDHILWSDMEYQIYGFEPGQFGGGIEDWGRYALVEDRQRVRSAIQLAMEERREWMDFAFRIHRANDGELRHIEGTARFIYDDLGFVQRMVGVNIDVSERAKALEALQESEAKLRTLVESQKRFVADASHELRAPLTSIQGNLELLQRFKNMTQEDREIAISEAAREAARLGRLVSDLLALARGDAGMKLQLEPTHLGEVVREAVSELQHLSEGKQVIAENLPEVRVKAQRDKLKQLAIILLENALKYTPIGGTVRLELQQNQSQAELRVSDNGIGIAPADLSRVFERFYRADLSRSKTQDPGGTGLGLPIAKWIVEQHGGEIWLESAVEKGTTAVVRLPIL